MFCFLGTEGTLSLPVQSLRSGGLFPTRAEPDLSTGRGDGLMVLKLLNTQYGEALWFQKTFCVLFFPGSFWRKRFKCYPTGDTVDPAQFEQNS